MVCDELLVGFYGYLLREVLVYWLCCIGGCVVDLDVLLGVENHYFVLFNYCYIFINMISNVFAFKSWLVVVVCVVGMDKCDGGCYVVELL